MTHANFTMGPGSKLYESFSYPAGELQVRLTEEGRRMAGSATSVSVRAHLRSPEDIVRLCLLMDAVASCTEANIDLILPYLPYARADRRFTEGDCYGLLVFASILRPLGLVSRIATLDVHSPAAFLNIGNLVNISPEPLIAMAIGQFAQRHRSPGVTVLFPDEGAAKHYAIPDNCAGCNAENVEIQILNCTKKRDAQTGKLSGFNVPSEEAIQYPLATLIVDDICDGGGTFIGVADSLANQDMNLGLYVTHGIFSKGFEELHKRFDRIYSTDSFGVERHDRDVHTFECGPLIRKSIATEATCSNR